jgi:hypothetical protein
VNILSDVCLCVWLFNVISFKLISKFTHSLFTNKFMKNMSAVENSSSWNLSWLMVNVMFVFVSFLFLELYISWGIFVVIVNPSRLYNSQHFLHFRMHCSF